MRRTVLTLILAVLLIALVAAPGCYMFSRSKHSITPPETELRRKTEQTVPSGKATVIWEIDITPPKEPEAKRS